MTPFAVQVLETELNEPVTAYPLQFRLFALPSWRTGRSEGADAYVATIGTDGNTKRGRKRAAARLKESERPCKLQATLGPTWALKPYGLGTPIIKSRRAARPARHKPERTLNDNGTS